MCACVYVCVHACVVQTCVCVQETSEEGRGRKVQGGQETELDKLNAVLQGFGEKHSPPAQETE